jgi:hypothetical protein
MVTLDKIQIFPSNHPASSDGTDFYAPLIKSFSTLYTDDSTPFLTVNTTEYSDDNDISFRGVFVDFMLSANGNSGFTLPVKYRITALYNVAENTLSSTIDETIIYFNADINLSVQLQNIFGYLYAAPFLLNPSVEYNNPNIEFFHTGIGNHSEGYLISGTYTVI